MKNHTKQSNTNISLLDVIVLNDVEESLKGKHSLMTIEWLVNGTLMNKHTRTNWTYSIHRTTTTRTISTSRSDKVKMQ